ncbi:hua2-like protein 2 [Phtheirospermum japonicum]|uniref:Hua2-like protein 2 n=1 Tax=Phtheirospermum japonicum TaxID=374723 RepID=A0A830B9U5_9LAMI|nr:hua2-like protein 2 [Phtheirospermum japonicum]
MAPTRRQGAIRAPAAVRQKWKVGDLVLAKVKGFPAWPATVSEPQKWGYPADLKKILVYFFGTQQIAFCNPADVEEFTEEQKVYLLGKRRGKGSDFIRALKEIVDCFENLKKQDQATIDNLTEETIITSENNSDESFTNPVNDKAPANSAIQRSGGATYDLMSLTEAAIAVAANDALLDGVMQLEEAHSNSGFAEICLSSTRSKFDAAQPRKFGVQRRMSSRRLRSCSRTDAGARHTSMLPTTDNSRSSRQLGTNAWQGKSLRYRRIMNSFDDSEWHNVNTPDFVSNDSIEDSDVMTVESDTLSFNVGSSVDSGCKTVEEESFDENNGGEPELSDRLYFQTNVNIIKKKRNPNRKRNRNDIVPVAKLDDVISESEVCKTDCVSPSHKMIVSETCVKDSGDEHLPLVKRARARMDRPSPAVDEEGTLVHEAEKTLEVSVSVAVQSFGPLNCNVFASAVGESVPIEGGLGNSYFLHASPARKYQSWETRKNFVDGEAALPPSKRLHRALEAMSAMTEDSQRASSSLFVNDHINGCCSSSSAKCSDPPIREEAAAGSGSRLVEDHTSGDFQSSVPKFCVGLNMEVPENDGKAPVMVSISGKTSLCTDSPNPEICKDSLEHTESADSKRLKLSTLNEHLTLTDHSVETDTEHQHDRPDSHTIGGELSQLDCNPPCLMMSLGDCKVGPSESKVAAKIPDSDSFQMNSGSVSLAELSCVFPNATKDIQMDGSDGGVDETQKEMHLCLFEDNQDSRRSEFMGEARPASTYSNIAPSATHVKVLASGRHSTSVSDDHLEDRVVSVTRSSNLVDGSVARASSRGSSMSNISPSDNDSYVRKNSSCSNVQLHPEKNKLTGKSSSNPELMSSFEAIIRSLTRTKESIGRATRIAIDCAKSGSATKVDLPLVVEVLGRNLDRESNPHKKVDLFFLVDSITQCSGGMKGDAGVYPSAIQELLPRLLLAAAPPGSSFHENHRQCLKVLRVWLDRKILPESIIRHHIHELEVLSGSHVTSGSRRCRFERPFDDPIRETEGMSVDEYGSNSSIQLPGFCMPPLLRDDIGSDSDGESVDAVIPEHNVEYLNGEMNSIAVVERRSHVLEDVDCELEMEDVSPSCEVEITATSNIAQTNCTQTSHHQYDNHYGAPFVAQQLQDTQAISAPPPPPPPLPPPLPLSGFYPAILDSVSNVPDSNRYPSSQEPGAKQSCLLRVNPRSLDAVHHRVHGNTDSETQLPRQTRYHGNACPNSDHQSASHFSGRASNGPQPMSGGKGYYHLCSPHLAPSNQFSFIQEQQIQSRKDISHPPHPNRFHTHNAENRNFYRDRDCDRYRFARLDDIGEHWRQPLPSISGPYHRSSIRMAHAPTSHNGLPFEPELPNNRWNCPPRSMCRNYSPHRAPPSEGLIPVPNRGLSSALYNKP